MDLQGEDKWMIRIFGEVVELVYTADLKSAAELKHAGSSPAFATKKYKEGNNAKRIY